MSVSEAPNIVGLSVLNFLKSSDGGDTYLYHDDTSLNEVSVTVFDTPASDSKAFDSVESQLETLMTVSQHPVIVTVLQVGVTVGAHPYVVAEYCTKLTLKDQYQSERMSVNDVLDIGIKLAGAVEYAHQMGLLVGPFTPSDVLLLSKEQPILSRVVPDFVLTGLVNKPPQNSSIPWVAPEVGTFFLAGIGKEQTDSFEDTGGVPYNTGTDVYSLGAITYTLLAGHSPFEYAGAPRATQDIAERICNEELPFSGRFDSPESLEKVFAKALDKDPLKRFASAREFGKALQQVQVQLAVTPTKLIVDSFSDTAAAEVSTNLAVVEDRAGESGSMPLPALKLTPVKSVRARSVKNTASKGIYHPHESIATRNRPKLDRKFRPSIGIFGVAALVAAGIFAFVSQPDPPEEKYVGKVPVVSRSVTPVDPAKFPPGTVGNTPVEGFFVESTLANAIDQAVLLVGTEMVQYVSIEKEGIGIYFTDVKNSTQRTYCAVRAYQNLYCKPEKRGTNSITFSIREIDTKVVADFYSNTHNFFGFNEIEYAQLEVIRNEFSHNTQTRMVLGIVSADTSPTFLSVTASMNGEILESHTI